MKTILANIRKDYLLHFFYGTFIGAIFVGLFGIYGVILTTFVAGAIELYDKYFGKGKPSVIDFAFTVVPSIIILLVQGFGVEWFGFYIY